MLDFTHLQHTKALFSFLFLHRLRDPEMDVLMVVYFLFSPHTQKMNVT